MRFSKLSVAVLIAACVAGCGGNSTRGVTIAPASATVIVRGSQTFSAVGTGSTTNTVNWQENCLSRLQAETNRQFALRSPGRLGSGAGSGPTGVGTISQTGQYTAPSTIPATNPILVVATSTVETRALRDSDNQYSIHTNQSHQGNSCTAGTVFVCRNGHGNYESGSNVVGERSGGRRFDSRICVPEFKQGFRESCNRARQGRTSHRRRRRSRDGNSDIGGRFFKIRVCCCYGVSRVGDSSNR